MEWRRKLHVLSILAFLSLISTHKCLKSSFTLHWFTYKNISFLCEQTIIFIYDDYYNNQKWKSILITFKNEEIYSGCLYAYIIFLQTYLWFFFGNTYLLIYGLTEDLVIIWSGSAFFSHHSLLLFLETQLKKYHSVARSIIGTFVIILGLFCWQFVSLYRCL